MTASLRNVAISVSVSAMLSTVALALQAQNEPAQSQNASSTMQQQYRMAVERANNEPFKVDVQPMQQGVQPGTPIKIKVELRNARNEPVNAVQPVSLEIKTKTPQNIEQTQKVTITPYTSSAEVSLTPGQAGLWKLEAREEHDHLKSGSNYMVVSAPPQSTSHTDPHLVIKKSTPAQDKKTKKANQPSSKLQGYLEAPRLVLAAFALEPQDGVYTGADRTAGYNSEGFRRR